MHNVVTRDQQSIERFVKFYSHKLKAVVKSPTMHAIEIESKPEIQQFEELITVYLSEPCDGKVEIIEETPCFNEWNGLWLVGESS